ncbi:hypothetical protein KKE45_00075 [Patescibacteria group bacterium]|nr:hypothetical protein [Patescibacteria group bacterium]
MKTRVISSDGVPRAGCFESDSKGLCAKRTCEKIDVCIQVIPVGRVPIDRGVTLKQGVMEGGVPVRR